MSTDNIYLTTPIGPLFIKTAVPIILVMLVNGLFTVVDAYFLGQYVGADALVAITLIFPLYIFLIALTTLVSGGFSSIYARQIGAADPAAAATFTSAIQLSLAVCGVLFIVFALQGGQLTHWIAQGNTNLAAMGHTYMAILIYSAPLGFVLALYRDALRAEGQLAAMAGIAIGSALLNIAFDYLLIVSFGMGVAGSAIGTVLSQFAALAAVVILGHKTDHRPPWQWRVLPTQWTTLIALGAPTSLGFIGIALSSGATLYALQTWASADYAALSGAFGIINRATTLTYLPLLGLAMTLQTIVGNNAGAAQPTRASSALRFALSVAFIYCAVVQSIFAAIAPQLGAIFVDNAAISAAIADIIPISTAALFLMGPMMMVARYFQALGDAKRAAILGLAKTYAFTLPMILVLPHFWGALGIWMAGPIAECLMVVVTLFVLMQTRKKHSFLAPNNI